MHSNPETLAAMSRLELLRLRFMNWLREKTGWLLEKLHIPARIREFEYVDPITNETVYLSTGAQYSVLHLGDKQFFFDRLTGRFDGTGTLLEKRIADRLELLD